MNVGRRMKFPVITVNADAPITKAHEIMSREKVSQLPVLKNNKLVGVIGEEDILKAYPSSATTLAVWEITSLIEKIAVKDVMSKNVFTVADDTPIEEAARILADNKISSLPVMRDGELVGIITETDLFRIMLEMLGARHPGVRITVLTPNIPGTIAKVAGAIFENGGNITAMSTFEGDSANTFMISAKVEGIEAIALRELITPLVTEVLDVAKS